MVNVSVRSRVKTRGHGPLPPGMDEDHPLFQFMQPGQGAPMRGEGSGFIVSADGLILTNAHVVDDAQKVTVKLTDRREFEARVIGSDEKSDVAVLKIDAQDLPVVRLGDPRSLQVGEWVVAIGSPFGFENSVTAGIVSAKGRNLPDDTYVPFIQTDVAVNPGNSGGPLFNLRGEVVGINSQIYSRSGGYQGLSFAIPIDVAMNVGKQLPRHSPSRSVSTRHAARWSPAWKRAARPRSPDSGKATSSSNSTGSRSIPRDSCRRRSLPRIQARPWPCRCGVTGRPARSRSSSARRPTRTSWRPMATARAPGVSA